MSPLTFKKGLNNRNVTILKETNTFIYDTIERNKKNVSKSLCSFHWEVVTTDLTFALVLLIVAFTFLGRVIGVDGYSMEPTLDNGDMLLLQCVGYEPQRGDIVVLRKPFADITSPIVKRVIALGGQTVEIDYDTSTLYVDGMPQDEPYLGEPMYTPGSPYEQGTYWEVPEGSIFVMGDNRNASADSRHIDMGEIPEERVLGKVLFLIFPGQNEEEQREFGRIGVVR